MALTQDLRLQERTPTLGEGLHVDRLLVNDRNYERNILTLQFKSGSNVLELKQLVETKLAELGWDYETDAVTNGYRLKVDHTDILGMETKVNGLVNYLNVVLKELDTDAHTENSAKAVNNKQVKEYLTTVITNAGYRLDKLDEHYVLPKELEVQSFYGYSSQMEHMKTMNVFKNKLNNLVTEVIEELKRLDWADGTHLVELANDYNYTPTSEETNVALNLWADSDLKGLLSKMLDTNKYGKLANTVRVFNEDPNIDTIITELTAQLSNFDAVNGDDLVNLTEFEKADLAIDTEIKAILTASYTLGINEVARLLALSDVLEYNKLVGYVQGELKEKIDSVKFFI